MRVDFDGIRASSSLSPDSAQDDIRLTREELIGFFTQAWDVTTTILPMAATASLLEVPPAGAPRLELHVQNERPETSGKPRTLRTFDLGGADNGGSRRWITPDCSSPSVMERSGGATASPPRPGMASPFCCPGPDR
jgi:hypothetical protein